MLAKPKLWAFVKAPHLLEPPDPLFLQDVWGFIFTTSRYLPDLNSLPPPPSWDTAVALTTLDRVSAVLVRRTPDAGLVRALIKRFPLPPPVHVDDKELGPRTRSFATRKRRRLMEAAFRARDESSVLALRRLDLLVPHMPAAEAAWLWTVNYHRIQDFLGRLTYCSHCRTPAAPCPRHSLPIQLVPMQASWHSTPIHSMLLAVAHRALFHNMDHVTTAVQLLRLFGDELPTEPCSADPVLDCHRACLRALRALRSKVERGVAHLGRQEQVAVADYFLEHLPSGTHAHLLSLAAADHTLPTNAEAYFAPHYSTQIYAPRTVVPHAGAVYVFSAAGAVC